MKYSREDFAKSQAKKLSVQKQDLSGRTLVVTGGNAGIGFQCVKEFATMNPSKIIMACRNVQAGNEAAAKVTSETGFKSIEVWQLDQCSFSSVRNFAKRYNESGYDLHVLLANAGTAGFGLKGLVLTEDKHETIIQTNHLSTMLLVLNLLPSVRRTAEKCHESNLPRIVVVASEVHYWTTFEPRNHTGNLIEIMDSSEHFKDSHERYQESKLCNVLFAQELALRLQSSPNPVDRKIVVSSCNPGLVKSSFFDHSDGLPTEIIKLARDVEQGCMTHIHTCIDPKAGQPGESQFYHNCAPTETADLTLGEEGQKLRVRVWNDSMEALGVSNGTYDL